MGRFQTHEFGLFLWLQAADRIAFAFRQADIVVRRRLADILIIGIVQIAGVDEAVIENPFLILVEQTVGVPFLFVLVDDGLLLSSSFFASSG